MSAQPKTPPRRRGSLGALGCLSIVSLMLFSVVEIWLLFRLDPVWLERIAFWRPPPFETEPLPVEDPSEFAAIEAEILAEMTPARRQPPAEVDLFPFLAASTRYEPATGARLETEWGARVEIPPAAIGAATEVSVTPILRLPDPMAVNAAGAGVDLRIGDEEHFRFAQPVSLTLPYDTELFDDVEVAVWEGDRWVPLPTTVDRAAGSATATTSHASYFIVVARILAAAGGAFAAGYTLPPHSWFLPVTVARSLGRAALYTGASTFETHNFRIYYYTSGEHAVPGASGTGIPSFVTDMAAMLEQCRDGLRSLGIQIRRATVRKHDVFLSKMSEPGDTPLGGPIFISTKIHEMAAKDGIDPRLDMQATVAHELMHVAQEQFFSMYGSSRDKWWLELTGAYMGDRLWQVMENTEPNIVRDFYVRSCGGSMLETPMDLSGDPEYYAYASMLQWLDRSEEDAGYRLFDTINQGGNATISRLDGALNSVRQVPLSDTFAEFAQEYLYRDLWQAVIDPSLHQGKDLPSVARLHMPGVGPDFRFTNLNVVRGDKLLENPYVSYRLASMRHLTATPFYMRVDRLPEKRRGKLVVKLDCSSSCDPGIWFYLGADTAGRTLPAGGSPSGLALQHFLDSPQVWVVDDISTEGGRDLVTLLAVSASTAGSNTGFTVSRWLLCPPEDVDFRRTFRHEPERWRITWQPSDIKKEKPFAGYLVYRWDPKQAAEPGILITEQPIKEEKLDHWAPDDKDYLYTVTVVDTDENESKHSLIERHDPFEGTWEGEVALAEGSLIDVFTPLLETWLGEPEDRPTLERAKVFLEQFDQIARLGIPVEFEIRRYESGRYFFRGTEVLWTRPDEVEDHEMRKRGDRVLEAVEGDEESGKKLILRVTRKDEIKERLFRFPVEVDGETKTLGLRWHFKRKALPDPNDQFLE